MTMTKTPGKNMKPKAIALWDKIMLSKRFIIETVNVQLKNITQIEHSRHRSPNGFILNLHIYTITIPYKAPHKGISSQFN